MNITMIPSADYVNSEAIKGKNVVIIDVLRATSVITTAFAHGASEVVAVREVDEARALKDSRSILGGERRALKIEGFDLSNSPLEYTKEIVDGRKIIMTTTNGTQAISKALTADKVMIACMLNGKAVAKHVATDNKDMVILCAGTNGKFSIDDFICAGKILNDLSCICKTDMDDMCSAACMAYMDHKDNVLEYVKKAAHYKYMLSIGLEDDIEFCFQEDITDIVPVYDKGRLIKA